MSDNTTLVLPVEVKALVVKSNAEPNLNALKPAKYEDLPAWMYDKSTKAYVKNNDHSGPFISDNVLNQDCSTVPYETGVHLHWKLPSLLTEGRQNGAEGNGNVEFPQVPNRWLITRIASNGTSAPTYTCWLIESDHIQKPSDVGKITNPSSLGPTIPHIEWDSVTPSQDPSLAGCRYVNYKPNFHNQGKVTKQTEGTGDVVNTQETTGDSNYLTKLYATGSENFQEISFSGIYTQCRNVFGFLDDEAITLPEGTTCSYHVAGWYDNSPSPRDPVSLGIITTSDVTRHYPNFTTAISESWSTMCTGSIVNVNTKATADKAGSLDVTITNNLPEAISSYVASQTGDVANQDKIENLLNALQTGILKKNSSGDLSIPLEEALHTQSFSKKNSGILYELKLKNGKTPVTGTDLDTLSGYLDQLNKAQTNLEQNLEEIESMRYRIFADWYKWSILNYADYPLIPAPLLPAPGVITAQMQSTVNFVYDEIKVGLAYLVGQTLDLQTKVSDCLNNFSSYPDYKLIQKKAPRYYTPNDPVLLFTGGDHISTHHNTKSKALARSLSDVVTAMTNGSTTVVQQNSLGLPALQSGIPTSVSELLTESVMLNSTLDQFLSTVAAHSITQEEVGSLQTEFLSGQTISSNLNFNGKTPGAYAVQDFIQPWNPVKMYWTCNYVPVAKAGDSGYDANVISSNFTLDPNDVNYKKTASVPTGTTEKYSNDCLLNISTLNNLKSQIDSYMDAYPKATIDSYKTEIDNVLNNCQLKSQQLSGFNQALLQKQQQLQMMVADPFAPAKNAEVSEFMFTNTLAYDAIQNYNNAAPRPGNVFNPIRGGYMQLTEVALVDSHGQVRKYNQGGTDGKGKLNVSIPSRLAAPDHDKFLYLSPALAQESRILMRWLSAADGSMESNSVPFSSPICGWVLPNFLDSSLNFYHADGTAIGMIISSAEDDSADPLQYISAPGTNTGNDLQTDFKGANTQLGNMAAGIFGLTNTGFKALLESINTTLPTVVPSAFRQDKAAGILMGRPLALTLASFKLDLKGLPANDLGWVPFNEDAKKDKDRGMNKGQDFIPRENSNFTNVNFPIRLGKLDKVNDGLVGYFVPNASGGIGNMDYGKYYAYTHNDSPVINPDTGGLTGQPAGSMANEPIQLTASGTTAYAAMLVDPQASIHATSGILPVKAIDIPAYFYADALKKISVSFLMAPVLQKKNAGMVLPIPEEKDGKWKWNSVSSSNTWNTPEKVSGKLPKKLTLDYDPQIVQEGWLTWFAPDDPSND
ncbi:hypothetical protein [Roseivirga thermotolerans]|uniref:Uncharacterized protein n=1 Tax=Roseivirga thermotolerans TaxID=1758176 RepID=A0ABQ3I469_9BACT|nr:hypothetical protein [Roseivirga thermotolerans]GHE55768.1 hypothetical protein GCM10011340_08180 [Roseivirga thermotolerans]